LGFLCQIDLRATSLAQYLCVRVARCASRSARSPMRTRQHAPSACTARGFLSSSARRDSSYASPSPAKRMKESRMHDVTSLASSLESGDERSVRGDPSDAESSLQPPRGRPALAPFFETTMNHCLDRKLNRTKHPQNARVRQSDIACFRCASRGIEVMKATACAKPVDMSRARATASTIQTRAPR
jgi:hypothetical protein